MVNTEDRLMMGMAELVDLKTRFIMTTNPAINYGGQTFGVEFTKAKNPPGHGLFWLRAIVENGDEFDFDLSLLSCESSGMIYTSLYPLFKDKYVTFVVAPPKEEEEED